MPPRRILIQGLDEEAKVDLMKMSGEDHVVKEDLLWRWGERVGGVDLLAERVVVDEGEGKRITKAFSQGFF